MREAICILTISITSAFAALDQGQVIYGDDNRHEPYEVSSFFDQAIKATAAQIEKRQLQKSNDQYQLFSPFSHGVNRRLCKNQRFFHQRIAASCSSFLIKPNVIATAGHCLELYSPTACEDHHWVFDFKVNKNGSSPDNFTEDQVYSCRRVIKSTYDSRSDFALIELDRPVAGRQPLEFQQDQHSLTFGDKIAVVGFPDELPLKVTTDGLVFSNDGHTISTNLDTFHGNSGSPVINQISGKVVGALVSGKIDHVSTFSSTEDRMCNIVNICSEDRQNCTDDRAPIEGERVSSSSQFLPYL